MKRILILSAAIVMVTLGIKNTSEAQLGSFFAKKPAVPEISAPQLRKMLTDQAATQKTDDQQQAIATEPSFVLVDVRSEPEYRVSVIPGAIPASEFEKDPAKYKGRTVITYCTSGYRSEKYARKLIDEGWDARNFKGSILGWCAAKYPLETLDRKPTQRVNTYNSRNRVPEQYEAVW
ncbi:rhodanese-like domain-containing protein [Novipirellula artificiosorum]|uniref:Rhodanese domain-containing protein n=1 Tax=Novipirellula artificiosorum TaxID=2528016 RepID=A0A5C6DJW6_9BACT|nr:rhodanese-like domain-containing protein [Novipirellula artificiosorum]TWU37028.1 hypothetical protein Poly41_31540 [Novipirellula artificiosorum]